MRRMLDIAGVGEVMKEGKHHDLVQVRGLTLVADRIQRRATGRDQSLLRAGDRQIAVMSQRAYSL